MVRLKITSTGTPSSVAGLNFHCDSAMTAAELSSGHCD
jgi:hypothetical protein